jgi:hypothetical protein
MSDNNHNNGMLTVKAKRQNMLPEYGNGNKKRWEDGEHTGEHSVRALLVMNMHDEKTKEHGCRIRSPKRCWPLS